MPNAPLSEISMTFVNNSAVQSGNSIYSPNIYDCYAGKEYYNASRAQNFLDKVSHDSLVAGVAILLYIKMFTAIMEIQNFQKTPA